MGANMFMLVLAFLNNKLIYVFLDQEANGVYFLVVRFSTLVSLLLGEWMRLSNLNIAGGDRSLNRALLSNTIWYNVFLGVLLLFGFLFLSPILPAMFIGTPRSFMIFAIAGGVGLVLMNCLQSLLLANQRMGHYAFTLVILSIVFLGLDFLFLVVLRMGLRSVLIAWIAGIAAGSLWSFFTQIRMYGYSLRPSASTLNQSRKVGLKALIAISGMFLMVNIHAFVIGTAAGNATEGLVMAAMFSVCFRIFQLLQRFSDVSSALLHSRVVQKHVTTSHEMTVLAVRGVILFSLTASALSAGFGRNIIIIISDSKYIAAYHPLLIMLPGIIAVSAGSIVNGFYWGKGYPLRITVAPFIAAAIGVRLHFLLAPGMGLSGITLSFSIMTTGWFLYIATVFSRDSGLPLSEIFIPRLSDLKRFTSRLRRVPAKEII